MPHWLNKYAIVRNADGLGSGGGEGDGAAAAKKEGDEGDGKTAETADDKNKPGAEKAAGATAADLEKASAEELRRIIANMSKEKEELLGDVMKKKSKLTESEKLLKEYGEISPDKVRELLDRERQAEEARVAAEREAAERAGDFERVKEMMAEQHRREVEELKANLTTKSSREGELVSVINELTIGNSFSGSGFIRDNLLLSPAKARTLYGGHFDSEDGKIVAYDKPRGAANRTPLVDSQGNNLDFEAAIEHIIQNDPDKDSILKSKMKKGAGSRSANVEGDGDGKAKDDGLYGSSRISATISQFTGLKR